MEESMPSTETLLSLSFELNDRQNELVSDVSRRINEVIPNLPFFNHQSDEEREHTRLVLLSMTKYLIDKYSIGHGEERGERFVFPIFEETETIFLYAQTTSTIVGLIYLYMSRNIVEFGLFTEYWGQIRINMAFAVCSSRDVFLHTGITIDEYRDVLDRSFEANRVETIDKIYGEHHNYKLHFSKEKELKRDNDNTECQLCLSRSDYVCEKCKYPLCNKCISHIKRSNNTCPSCRTQPLILRRITEGDFSIENDTATEEVENNSDNTDDINNNNNTANINNSNNNNNNDHTIESKLSDEEEDHEETKSESSNSSSSTVIDVIDKLDQ